MVDDWEQYYLNFAEYVARALEIQVPWAGILVVIA
jgi:hypothetical protein